MPPLIRLATPDDADQVLAIYGPYCLTPVSFELEPPSREEMRSRLAKVLTQCPWLVCDAGGDVWGYAYACAHRERAAYRWSVDAAVYCHPRRQRHGVGRGLYTSLFRLLALQGYVNAYAGVTQPNPASVGLHEAMGFRPVGTYARVGFKCGAWYAVAWYQREIQPHPAEPSPPRAVGDVSGTVAWQAALESGLALVKGS